MLLNEEDVSSLAAIALYAVFVLGVKVFEPHTGQFTGDAEDVAIVASIALRDGRVGPTARVTLWETQKSMQLAATNSSKLLLSFASISHSHLHFVEQKKACQN